MNLNVKITPKGIIVYRISLFLVIGILFAVGFIAYIFCADNPRIQHIADVHIDALSTGLMTYASISVGFILTEFALLLSLSSNPIFKNWQASGKFNIWKALHFIALLTSICVLVSSFILLGWENSLPIVAAILAVNALSMFFVFIPLLVIAGDIFESKDK